MCIIRKLNQIYSKSWNTLKNTIWDVHLNYLSIYRLYLLNVLKSTNDAIKNLWECHHVPFMNYLLSVLFVFVLQLKIEIQNKNNNCAKTILIIEEF